MSTVNLTSLLELTLLGNLTGRMYPVISGLVVRLRWSFWTE